jgi:hypothetical protein
VFVIEARDSVYQIKVLARRRKQLKCKNPVILEKQQQQVVWRRKNGRKSSQNSVLQSN